jgi:N-carbamoyl-L-amino-acid hydrolase
MSLQVNFKRLQDDIDTLSNIGLGDDHGLYRMAFTDADLEARKWLSSRIEDAGLDLYVDEAANLHARHQWDGKRPSVITGSHIDTVPCAGALDGALGVMIGLECLRSIREQQLPLKYPLECIAFSDEEGRFGGMMGSQALSGQLTPEAIYNASDLEGNLLCSVMESLGYPAKNILRAQRHPDSIRAYVELHIEQGPVLDQQGISIGLVEAIAGLLRWNVRLIGEAMRAPHPCTCAAMPSRALPKWPPMWTGCWRNTAARAARPPLVMWKPFPVLPTWYPVRPTFRWICAIPTCRCWMTWPMRSDAPSPPSLVVMT